MTKQIMLTVGFFEEKLGRKLHGKPAIIDFHGTWCLPCKKLDQYLSKIEEVLGSMLNIIKLNTSDEFHREIYREIATLMDIGGVPYILIFYSNGELAGDVLGAFPKRMLELIKETIKNA